VTSLALTGIGTLVTCDESLGSGPLGVIGHATVVCDDGRVVYAGPEASAPSGTDVRVDAEGRCVVPGFVDSHTHLIFAGDRAAEFGARMAGAEYHPGGILDTVAATRAASADELERSARRLIGLARLSGTTTVEIKTGYGLDAVHEAGHLAIARRLTEDATLLGAHLIPAEFAANRAGYIQLVCDTMIPAASGTARWCDVFCERGAFDVDESRAVLDAARSHGLGLRVHANQLGPSGGVDLACEAGAASADHCTHLTPADIDSLASSDTVATLLPISDFCTRQPYPDGRALLDAGAVVALASNCNPGSSYSISMPLALALAVRHCGLTVEEAILAATVGGAAALQRTDVGTLRPGAQADAVLIDAPHPDHLVYRLGTPLVAGVVLRGAWEVRAGSDLR
jgi:imidazolonepropionase